MCINRSQCYPKNRRIKLLQTRILLAVSCIFSLVAVTAHNAQADPNAGLKIAAAVDLYTDFALQNNSLATDRPNIRGAEVSLYAPIDHGFDGFFSAVAHDESGAVNFEVHEAFLTNSKLINRARFRIGQFFLGIGRLNRFHQHDWPFISAPKVHSEFFDKEGVYDIGIEFAYLLPTPFFLELTLGVTGGYNFGHSHSAGNKPLFPTHYSRLGTFFDFGATGSGMELGVSYLGRKSASGEENNLFGTDLTAKWREGKVIRYLLQSETWFRYQNTPISDASKYIGSYLFGQYGATENWMFGPRLDIFSYLNRKNSLNQEVKNYTYAYAPTVTYKHSEFSTFRIAYYHEATRVADRQRERDRFLEAQMVFILGAHPAHDF